MKDCEYIERLLEFVLCEDSKGKSVCNYLLKAHQYSDLDPKMCRSQTRNGDGNMSGKTKEAAAQFCLRTQNEKAVCFHCASHKPNLCLPKASKVLQVSAMQFLGLIGARAGGTGWHSPPPPPPVRNKK